MKERLEIIKTKYEELTEELAKPEVIMPILNNIPPIMITFLSLSFFVKNPPLIIVIGPTELAIVNTIERLTMELPLRLFR